VTEVRIDELHTTVDVVPAAALLDPEVLRLIVAAVRASTDARTARDAGRAADLDTRSIVEQQRTGRG
jgi:hypothetical protein